MPKRKLLLPRCKYCGRRWIPPSGLPSSRMYCPKCSKERQQAAKIILESGTVTVESSDHRYVYTRPKSSNDTDD